MGIFEKLKEDGFSAYKKRDYKKAIEYYNKALSIRNDAEILYGKALCYYHIGKYRDAIECHNKALQLNPYIQEDFMEKLKNL